MTTKDQTKDQPSGVHDIPNEYPFLLYNHKTRQQKGAKDKEEYDKLTAQGFTEEPLPPLDPDGLTPDEAKTLQTLLAKAAKALEKLGQLSQQEQQSQKQNGEKKDHPSQLPAGKK